MRTRHLVALVSIICLGAVFGFAQSTPVSSPYEVGVTNLDFEHFPVFVPSPPWTDESGLIGDWHTADSRSIYNFGEDHSVTQWWWPKDHPVIVGNTVQAYSMAGHWKLDGKQLVITMDSEFVPESSGKGTTVHPSSEQGTTSWTIVSVSDSTMTWSTTTSHNCVSRSIELNLRRMIVHHSP